jgi:hypothetical protein
MVLLIANAEFFLHGLFPKYINLMLLPDVAYFTLACIFDIVSLLALLAVLIAIARRLFFPPKYIDARTPDAFIILSLVGILMIAFFGMHGAEIAHSAVFSDMASHKIMLASRYMPVSNFVGTVLLSPTINLNMLASIFWWIHAIVLLTFLNYLPYSKHMHILTSIFNCFFKSIDKVTTQPIEEFKKGNVFCSGGKTCSTHTHVLNVDVAMTFVLPPTPARSLIPAL